MLRGGSTSSIAVHGTHDILAHNVLAVQSRSRGYSSRMAEWLDLGWGLKSGTIMRCKMLQQWIVCMDRSLDPLAPSHLVNGKTMNIGFKLHIICLLFNATLYSTGYLKLAAQIKRH